MQPCRSQQTGKGVNTSSSAYNKALNAVLPIQPFFVTSSTEYFKKTSELPSIAHCYKFTENDNAEVCRAVPDGAIDVIVKCDPSDPTGFIYGTTRENRVTGFDSNATYFGVRLLVGGFDRIGDISIKEMMDGKTPLDDVFRGDSLVERLVAQRDFLKQIKLFEEAFQNRNSVERSSANMIASAILQEVYKTGGNIKVNDLEDTLHYSRRHLSRIFESLTGMSIKEFSEYVRFQAVLKRMNSGEFQTISMAASEGNFYDQAHFQKLFKKFTNMTPREYMKLLDDIKYQERLVVL